MPRVRVSPQRVADGTTTLVRWVPLSTVAEFLGVKPGRVRKLVAEGDLPEPSYQLGARMPRWDLQAVEEAVKQAARWYWMVDYRPGFRMVSEDGPGTPERGKGGSR